MVWWLSWDIVLELLLDVYKQVFQIGSLEEAESSIFNTNINEE